MSLQSCAKLRNVCELIQRDFQNLIDKNEELEMKLQEATKTKDGAVLNQNPNIMSS